MVAGYRNKPVRVILWNLLLLWKGILGTSPVLPCRLLWLSPATTSFVDFTLKIHFSTPPLTSSKNGDSLHFILNESNCDTGVPALHYLHIYHSDSSYLLKYRSTSFVWYRSVFLIAQWNLTTNHELDIYLRGALYAEVATGCTGQLPGS